MKTIEHYEQIANNYVNGNISDFKVGLKKLTKKELLVFVSLFEDFLPEVNADGEPHYRSKAHRANTITHKFLA